MIEKNEHRWVILQNQDDNTFTIEEVIVVDVHAGELMYQYTVTFPNRKVPNIPFVVYGNQLKKSRTEAVNAHIEALERNMATLHKECEHWKTQRGIIGASFEWEACEGGSYNPNWTGYTPGHYCTGNPELGWVLYSEGGSGWNQRTKLILAPVPGAYPKRVMGKWYWIAAEPDTQPLPTLRPMVLTQDDPIAPPVTP